MKDPHLFVNVFSVYYYDTMAHPTIVMLNSIIPLPVQDSSTL